MNQSAKIHSYVGVSRKLVKSHIPSRISNIQVDGMAEILLYKKATKSQTLFKKATLKKITHALLHYGVFSEGA